MLLTEIKPVKGKVLIRKDKTDDKTTAGIILGTNDKGRRVTATVLAGALEGKRIVFHPGISSTFDVDGDKVSVIFEYDIIAIL